MEGKTLDADLVNPVPVPVNPVPVKIAKPGSGPGSGRKPLPGHSIQATSYHHL